MGAPWVVHEGYVLVRPPPQQQQQQQQQSSPGSSPTRTGAALHALVPNGLHTHKTKLIERYVVIYMNRKLEFYEAATATPPHAAETDANGTPDRRRVGDALYVSAFAGWDGDGLLKVGESYGLELKVDRKPHASGRNTTSLFIAAFNRVDLEKWCRALVAVLDPQSAAGEDVRREHRRERKEAKRLELEREEKIRKWRELKLKQIEEERERMLAREEEISNMTPLERVDGLGSLDDDTARLLEKRKLRLQKRHAPTTGRVTKTAYRKRIEDGAGGKLENVQPLQPKVVETKARVRVELPLPGQFIEAAGVSSTHRIGLPHSSDRARVGSLSSSSGSSSHEHPSDTSSSVSSTSHSHSSAGHVPPPPPPPHALVAMMTQSQRASFVPPPPPPRSGSGFVDVHRHDTTDRASRSGSVRGSLYDAADDFDAFDTSAERRSDLTRASFSQSRRRLSGVEREKIGIQDSLAAILSGRPSARRDSIDSSASGFSVAKVSKKNKSTLSTDPPMANAFAASLAAIRRNRADTMDDTSAGSTESPPVSTRTAVRSRTRKSQLSAEAKELLQKAIGGRVSDARTSATASASKPTGGRKGLFDDSSSESDNDDDSSRNGGLFATPAPANGRRTLSGAKQQRNGVKQSDDRRSSTTPTSSRGSSSADPHRATARGFDDPDDSASDVTDASQSENGTSVFAKKPQTASPLSTASLHSTTSSVPAVSVAYVTSAVQTDGKKPVGVYTFALRVAGARDHSVTFSYSELEAIHVRLSAEWSTTRATDALPKFPPKHRLRNNTKPENMHKRALELLAYLQQLVALPRMVTHPRFVFEFRIDDAFAKRVRGESAAPDDGASGAAGRAHVAVSPVQTTAAAAGGATSPTLRRRVSNGKPAAAVRQSLFDVASDDSDSDSDASSAPPSRVQPRQSDATARSRRDDVDARPSRATKASARTDKRASEPVATARRRPSSTASRAPTESASVPVAAPLSSNGPSVAGLPPRPNLFGNGRGDLLAAIRQGTALKKVETPDAPATVSAPSSTARPPTAAAPTLAPVGSIADAITNAMASRRIHVEYEDAHSDDDADSDDDWD